MRSSRKKGNNSLYFKVFICFFIIGFLICLGRSFVAKVVLESIIQNRLGIKLSITGVDLNLTRGTMTMKDVVVDNPNGFQGTLAKLSAVQVDCDPYSFLKLTPRYREIALRITEFTIERRWNRELNTTAVKILADQKAQSKPVKDKPLIEAATLTVDNLKFIDYSQKEPSIQKIHLGLQQEKYYRLGSLNDLVQAVIGKIESQAGKRIK